MSRLASIVESKRREIEQLRSVARSDERPGHEPINVARALVRAPGAPLRLLAEFKRRSPSAGRLSESLDVDGRVIAYARAGATMVSVLCDGPFFGGSWDDLARARTTLDARGLRVPLLAKEFVLDEVQIDQARAAGADAVLLIARIVSAERLRELFDATRSRGLEPLVEVMNEEELAAASACGARIVGVNARDLDTLAMDGARAARILAAIPSGVVKVHLSGIKTEDDVRALARGPADAALLGEVLMRDDDPEPRLRALVAAASG